MVSATFLIVSHFESPTPYSRFGSHRMKSPSNFLPPRRPEFLGYYACVSVGGVAETYLAVYHALVA